MEKNFFQYPRLGVGPVKHRKIGIGFSGLKYCLDEVCRFVVFVSGFVKDDFIASVFIRPEFKNRMGGIFGYDPVGGIQDKLSRSVIPFQMEFRNVRIIKFEIQNIPEIGTAPAVDTLRCITDYADIPPSAAKYFCQLVLGFIGVLILVNQNIPEFILQSGPDVTVYL
jgi:hypothetical protein